MTKQFSTSKRQIEILKNSKFPEGLLLSQTLRVWCWTIFNKKKFVCFLEKLNNGMHIKYAYEATKRRV